MSVSVKQKVATGAVHAVPADLRTALLAKPKALMLWNGLTPLARNEWICWTISVKTAVTRNDHVRRVVSQLQEGKRRPCCWIGCIHRTDKTISPSVQGILNKRARQK